MKIRILILAMLLISFCIKVNAQDFALKTNLASDAAANITLAGEARLAPRWTAQLGGSFNAWSFDDNQKRWKHWSLMPEVRYWMCDAMGGHFIGTHVFGGQYNVGGMDLNFKFLGTDFSQLSKHRYQGWYVGAGIAYGYAWELSHHWNIEAEIGFGWSYTRYDEFRCQGCGLKTKENRPHNYVGPTKAAINLVYIF